MSQMLFSSVRKVFSRIASIFGPKETMDYTIFQDQIKMLKAKYNLWECNFDSECIYNDGDLTDIIQPFIDNCFADCGITINETISEDKQRYIAELTNHKVSMQIYAHTSSDFLPDDFYSLLESIPFVFDSEIRLYQINPAIGLTGQDAWYFCGTHENLNAARQEGLPLVFPGEDRLKTKEYKKYRGLHFLMS